MESGREGTGHLAAGQPPRWTSTSCGWHALRELGNGCNRSVTTSTGSIYKSPESV